ncbi:fluoride efflux transporter CrcB [Engelhardtia mirabilis]|uniref:Fluoride-specific ion channel FluC n=1 Tax=Engelhardtia mirabilis TaxID=2528011 RepID=A0A518BN46_9BACT|nr:Putative fluoride ion transporter CrcB [Planctomycetes bacterium Pla133]QDV02689.1 Putative fluoride ion transporter CrcB [Planctomycetes bacterium Pla86]
MSGLREVLLVGTGGFAGAVARYLTGGFVTRRLGLDTVLATVTANMLGCLAIGLAVAWLEAREEPAVAWRLVLVVGFLGSYTTFSTFGYETVELLREGRAGLALANALGQLLVGLAAVVAGRAVGNALLAG